LGRHQPLSLAEAVRISPLIATSATAMVQRLLITAGLLLSGVVLTPTPAQAGWSEYSSAISEVDACNQAQYLMPEKAVVQEFRYRVATNKSGNTFICKVRWSESAKAQAADRPILFPTRIRQPILAGGWL